MPDDHAAQRAEWEAWEKARLAERRCPHSGERLKLIHDAWDRDSLCCPLCDCFGFNPTDPRIGVAHG